MKTLIIFPLTLLVVLYMIIGVIIPNYKEAASVSRENLGLSEQISGLEQDVADINGFTKEMNSKNRSLSFLEGYVPTDAKEQEVINTITNFARKNNVTLDVIGLGVESVDQRGSAEKVILRSLGGSVTVRGNYEQMLSFMRDLFYIKRLYTFSTISLERVGEAEDGAPTDELLFIGDFSYKYLDDISAIGISEFDDKLSFEVIEALEQGLENTDPITTTSVERGNPFLP